jgi:hypothetical protein
MRKYAFAIVILSGLLAASGCTKKPECAKGDSPQVCKAFQECLRSSTSPEVCREGEKDANR